MCRKYVQKWWLFKRNRKMCSPQCKECSCKWQICHDVVLMTVKRSEICLEKSKFFHPDSRPPQISNQIGAAAGVQPYLRTYFMVDPDVLKVCVMRRFQRIPE